MIPFRLPVTVYCVILALALSAALAIFPPRVRAADETITCAVCGKQVKKSKAIKVIKDGRVYWVCSQECADKLRNKKKS
jgi:YHS domain-containing protein